MPPLPLMKNAAERPQMIAGRDAPEGATHPVLSADADGISAVQAGLMMSGAEQISSDDTEP